MRMNKYWNSAYRTHPDQALMPVLPEAKPLSNMEINYTALHKTLEEEAIAILARRDRLMARQNTSLHLLPNQVDKEVV